MTETTATQTDWENRNLVDETVEATIKFFEDNPNGHHSPRLSRGPEDRVSTSLVLSAEAAIRTSSALLTTNTSLTKLFAELNRANYVNSESSGARLPSGWQTYLQVFADYSGFQALVLSLLMATILEWITTSRPYLVEEDERRYERRHLVEQ